MKRFFSVIVLIIITLDIGGYYLVFNGLQRSVQHGVREEIENGVKEADLALVVVPVIGESGISWIKQDKEFRYRGEMYDVVRKSSGDGFTCYYCLKDSREKQLIADYNKNQDQDKNPGKRIRRTFAFDYLPDIPIVLSGLEGSGFLFPSTVSQYPSGSSEIHSPPPRLT